jgi:hypothetical protein
MTHNPASMLTTGTGPKKGTRIPAPEDEAEAGAYRLEDGTCAIKGEAFVGAIVGSKTSPGAASSWKTKNRGTMKSVLAHIAACEDLVPLFYPDGTPIKEYVIDARTVIVNKGRIIRHRPRYDKWRTTVTIEYDPVLVGDPKMIVDILAEAGSRIAVGDHRPKFGRFRIIEYTLL